MSDRGRERERVGWMATGESKGRVRQRGKATGDGQTTACSLSPWSLSFFSPALLVPSYPPLSSTSFSLSHTPLSYSPLPLTYALSPFLEFAAPPHPIPFTPPPFRLSQLPRWRIRLVFHTHILLHPSVPHPTPPHPFSHPFFLKPFCDSSFPPPPYSPVFPPKNPPLLFSPLIPFHNQQTLAPFIRLPVGFTPPPSVLRPTHTHTHTHTPPPTSLPRSFTFTRTPGTPSERLI